jgi:hypothetical protein
MLPPQPFGQSPQFLPAGHCVSGVHGGAPHWFATPPPPHVWPAGHVPQLIELPQPSPVWPQPTFCPPQVSALQVGVPQT